MKNIFLIILSILVMPHTVFSLETTKPSKNCFIQMTSTYKTGVVKKRMRDFKMENKAKCENVRALYSQNFSPKEIIKVETTMEWVE